MARDRVGLREWLESSTWASGSRTVRALGSGLAMRRKPGALLSAGQESETKCSADRATRKSNEIRVRYGFGYGLHYIRNRPLFRSIFIALQFKTSFYCFQTISIFTQDGE